MSLINVRNSDSNETMINSPFSELQMQVSNILEHYQCADLMLWLGFTVRYTSSLRGQAVELSA